MKGKTRKEKMKISKQRDRNEQTDRQTDDSCRVQSTLIYFQCKSSRQNDVIP